MCRVGIELKALYDSKSALIGLIKDDKDFRSFYCSARAVKEKKYNYLNTIEKQIKFFENKITKIRRIHGVDIEFEVIDTVEEYEERIKRDNNHDNISDSTNNIINVNVNDDSNNTELKIPDINLNDILEKKEELQPLEFENVKVLEDESTYYSDYIGSSDIGNLLIDRETYEFEKNNKNISTKSMDEGQAIHKYLLESEEKLEESLLIVDGVKDKSKPADSTIKANKEKNPDKVVIGRGFYESLSELKDKLLSKEKISHVFNSISTSELPLVGELKFNDEVFKFRCKHDFIIRDEKNKSVMVGDIKTTTDKEDMLPDKWRYKIRNFGYDIQAYLYVEMLKAYDRANGINVDEYEYSFNHLVILRKDTYNCRLFELKETQFHYGKEKIIKALNNYSADEIIGGVIC